MNTVAIDAPIPNIDRWKVGNVGLPYVWTIHGDQPGVHVCITALVHGNEVCGAIAADTLLDELHNGLRVRRGSLSIVFANVGAYESFDRNKPFESRVLDEDFNRLWDASTLDGARNSRELTRARELRPFYDTVDHLLDLHSMLEPAPPIALAGNTEKGLALAHAIGAPQHILVDSGHAAGTRLRDYAGFGDPSSHKSALLVECGQHWERNVGVVGCDVMWRFLRHFEMFDRPWLDRVIGDADIAPQRTIDVSQVVTYESTSFQWIRPLAGVEIIAQANTLIAIDGQREIRTPHDEAIMVMPVRNPKPGQTAVRIGRFRERL